VPIINDLEKIKSKATSLQAEFDANWRPHLKEISQYVLPRKGRFLDDNDAPNDGKKRHQKIIDGVAIKALRTLGAGMQNGLTSPSRPWFLLESPIPGHRDIERVKAWLSKARSIMLTVFSKSNFYNSAHSTYLELGAFGTGAMLIEEDFENGIHCFPFTTGEYCIGANDRGVVDTFKRTIWMQARNVLNMFGKENVSDSILRSVDNKQKYEWVKVIHFIEPNAERDISKSDNVNMRYRSIYYENGGNAAKGKVLSVSGYNTFPAPVPRWLVTGSEVYGQSPAMEALGDVKQLQKVQEKKLKALDKIVDPPMNAPASMKNRHTTLVPGGVTFVDSVGGQGPSFTPSHVPNVNFQAVLSEVEALKISINEFFFADLFLLLSDPRARKDMTATEVIERQQEKLAILGPVVERMHSDFLSPIIDRVFDILLRNGLFPPPPPELAGLNLKVEMVSLLTQAQRLSDTINIEKAVSFIAGLSSIDPQAVDKLNTDKTIDEYGNLINLPADIINTDEEAFEIREARRIAEQQANMADNLQRATEGAKTLSETSLEGDTALNAVVQGAQNA